MEFGHIHVRIGLCRVTRPNLFGEYGVRLEYQSPDFSLPPLPFKLVSRTSQLGDREAHMALTTMCHGISYSTSNAAPATICLAFRTHQKTVILSK